MESRDQSQLHDKIARRRWALEAARTRMAGSVETAGSEEAREVDDALSALTTHLGGEWNANGQVEALHLASWLDSTEHLAEAADFAAHGS